LQETDFLVQSKNDGSPRRLNNQAISLRFSRFFEHKLAFLLVFAVVYGLVFINYIDVITAGGSRSGYHLWLVLMYFLPFAILSIMNAKHWKLTLGLGIIASLMNDIFYGLIRSIIGGPYDLGVYYTNWLIPGDALLFKLNLGFAVIQVQSWMMAASIYLRFVAVFILLEGWKYIVSNMQVSAYLSQKKLKINNIKTRQAKS
jgi:hypothetical protein